MKESDTKIYHIKIGKLAEELSFPVICQKCIWKKTDARLVKDRNEFTLNDKPALVISNIKKHTTNFPVIKKQLYIALDYVEDIYAIRLEDGSYQEIVTKEKIAVLRYSPEKNGRKVYALNFVGKPIGVRRPFTLNCANAVAADAYLPDSIYGPYKSKILSQKIRLFGKGSISSRSKAAQIDLQGKHTLTKLIQKSAEVAIKIKTLPQTVMQTYSDRLKEIDAQVVEMQKMNLQMELDMQEQKVKPVLELYHPVAIMYAYQELLEDIEEIDSIHDNKAIARFVKDKLIRFHVQQNPETAIRQINFYATLIDNIADDVDFIYLRDLNMLLMDLFYQVVINLNDLELVTAIIDGLSETHVNIIASKIEPVMEQGIEEIKVSDYYQFKHHFNDSSIHEKKDLLNTIITALIMHRKKQEGTARNSQRTVSDL